MSEPGLDRQEWEGRWESLAEDLEDSPRDVLPELDELVEEMLVERGYEVADPVVREGDEREVVAEFLAARETTQLLADDPDSVSPGDVAEAVNGYRSLYEYLVGDAAGP
jgi:malate synthase